MHCGNGLTSIVETASSRTWIKKTMDSEHGYYFIARSEFNSIQLLVLLSYLFIFYRFEKGGHAKGGIQGQPMLTGKVFSLSETCAWLEYLLAALDCYNWFFEKQLLDPNEVFLCESQLISKSTYTSFSNLL